MAKILYLMGAGASYGKRGDDFTYRITRTKGDIVHTSSRSCCNINEGLPVVMEIPQRLLYVRELIYMASCSNKEAKENLIADLTWLYNGTAKHATIDTFAKKLYLTGRTQEYERLKKVLSIYLIIEQIINNPDSRYDTFLANFLTQTIDIPANIKVLTWNYDSQFEFAFSEYVENIDTPRDVGCCSISDNDIAGLPSIIKINGTASFENWGSLTKLCKTESRDKMLNEDVLNIIIEAYINNKSLLSFAWETAKMRGDNGKISKIKDVICNAEVLVVIGYTFPFFNRMVDKAFIGAIKNLKKIYIQDPNADKVMQSIDAVLAPHQKPPLGGNIPVVPITDCSQFYLPPEL